MYGRVGRGGNSMKGTWADLSVAWFGDRDVFSWFGGFGLVVK